MEHGTALTQLHNRQKIILLPVWHHFLIFLFMNKIKSLAIFNALCFILHISLVYMMQFKMVNSSDVGEVSSRYETLFTPASITFAIWGVIYTSLAILCLYHVIMAFKHDKDHPANIDLLRISGLFIFNNLAAAGWLIAWTNEQILLSLVLMLVQLLSLISIHFRLKIVDRNREAGSLICTQWPLSIYLGWIAVATILNVSSYLVSINWNGAGISHIHWTVILIAATVFIALLMIFTRKNVSFGLVVIWTLYGIILKRQAESPEVYQLIIMTAWAGIAVTTIGCLIQFTLNVLYKRPGPHFPEAKYSLK